MSAQEVSWNRTSRFMVAIQANDVMGVEKMLKRGLDPDTRFQVRCQQSPAICLCAQNNHLMLVKLLLQAGCSINQSDSDGMTALHIAASNSYRDMVSLLIHKRAHVNAVSQRGQTPLHMASRREPLAVVRILVDAGADVNRCDRDLRTPLMNACIQMNVAMAGYLLSKKADVNFQNSAGDTALTCTLAQNRYDLELLNTLLRAGADVNVRDQRGETPLHLVAGSGCGRRSSSEAVEILMSHGCEIDAQNRLHHTPLHLAALFRDGQSVLRLVRAGCELDLVDELNFTPICYAIRQGSCYIVELLLAAGANIPRTEWRHVQAMTEVRDPALLARVLEDRYECRSLAGMCRRSILVHYGVNAQAVIGGLRLPTSIKRYLAYDIL